MKKLAILDFDGTIMDTVNDVVICFNRALTQYGFPTLTREEYIGRLGGDIDDIVALALQDKNTPENIEKVKKTYLDIYYSSAKENSVPFPKTLETLRKLEDMGVVLAINSNRFTDSIESFAERFLSEFSFLSIKGHDYDYPSKPDPTAVLDIIEMAGLDPDEVLYVGDSDTDIRTAKNAGVDCVIVKWGYGKQADWENEYILGAIDDFDELFSYFQI